MRYLGLGKWVVGLQLLLLGCGAGESPEAMPTPIAELQADLVVGSRGADVLAVHEELRNMGYFSSEKLALEYPAWRPVMQIEPADPLVFDEASAEALKLFQHRHQLKETGVVNGLTRAALAAPRCGTPEGIAVLDATDKYDQDFNFGLGCNCSYSYQIFWETGHGLTKVQMTAAVAEAMERWTPETKLSFNEVTSGNPAISFKFKSLTPPAIGQSTGSDIYLTTFNNQQWTQPGAMQVLIHEIGHSLGLAHSSVSDSVMLPSVATSTLGVDDKIAISQGRDEFESLPGILKGITIGQNGTVLGLGVGRTADGYAIFKWDEAIRNWTFVNGYADHIAVDSAGTSWAVTAAGVIYKRAAGLTASSDWVFVGGCATDIAAGGGGVWIIGCDVGNAYGRPLWKFNSSMPLTPLPFDPTDGFAARIAVGSDGIPWAASTGGTIFKRNSAFASVNGWTSKPGCARELAINPAGYPVAVGCGTQNLWAWNEQTATTSGGPAAIALAQWVQILQSGSSGPVVINGNLTAVGPKGELWVVDSAGNIKRAKK